ncbi:unnamed protein product [Moneuplotes crassus]|uniref:Uncharacterized protein n=1 Tax=Euplotes crassus TaxID=5936 RepID=A0AAD1U603_EUPCR|nr:unnamed protein product [Moneuplotes crassus]
MLNLLKCKTRSITLKVIINERSPEEPETTNLGHNLNNSMALPQVVKAPNFPKKIRRKNHASTNRSSPKNNRYITYSEKRPQLNSSMFNNRPAFNSNFSSRNSMAKRYRRRLFNTGAQVTQDFNPNTVYDGIEDIEIALEELEANVDNLDESGLNEVESEELDTHIELLMQNNKKLVKKVNICAEIVAKGISKAANLKSMKPITRTNQTDADLRQKKRTLAKIYSAIEVEKKKVKNLQNEFELICSSSLTDQNKMFELMNERRYLESETTEMQAQADFLKHQLQEMKKFEHGEVNKEKVKEVKHQMGVEFKTFKNDKHERDKEFHDIQLKNQALGSEIADIQSEIRTLRMNKNLILQNKLTSNNLEPESDKKLQELIQKKETVEYIIKTNNKLHTKSMKAKTGKITELESKISQVSQTLLQIDEINGKLSSELKALSKMSTSLQRKKMTRSSQRSSQKSKEVTTRNIAVDEELQADFYQNNLEI